MKSFQRKEYGSWDVYKKSYSRRELLTRRRQLAKVANSRILGLERARSEITGERYIDMPQFDVVTQYLENQGKKRFSEAMSGGRKMSEIQLKNEIVMLEGFLSSKVSTVGAYRRFENKRVNSFIDKGIPEDIAMNPEFYRFLSGESFQYLVNNALSSEDIIDLLETAADGGLSLDEIIRAFRQHEGHIASGFVGMEKRLKKMSVLKKEGKLVKGYGKKRKMK